MGCRFLTCSGPAAIRSSCPSRHGGPHHAHGAVERGAHQGGVRTGQLRAAAASRTGERHRVLLPKSAGSNIVRRVRVRPSNPRCGVSCTVNLRYSGPASSGAKMPVSLKLMGRVKPVKCIWSSLKDAMHEYRAAPTCSMVHSSCVSCCAAPHASMRPSTAEHSLSLGGRWHLPDRAWNCTWHRR